MEALSTKATIISHETVPGRDAQEIHLFRFCLEDEHTAPHAESISLRTARVLAAELVDGNAFVKMLHEIVRTEPHDYSTLIGKSFADFRSTESDAETA